MFKTPFTMNIIGPSKCGKTSLVSDLLENNETMMTPIHQKIIYCYSQFQPLFDYLETKIKNIEFVKGLPNLDDISNCLLVLDDLAQDCIDNKDIVHLFTVGSHHRNISVVLLTHNIFEKGKYMRRISLNCSYLVVFNNLRDKKQIKYLGTQLFPGEIKYFEEILQDVFSKQEHGFLIIDLLPTTLNEFRLRTFDFKNKKVYVYIKN
jgi:GTPase SAR1 family protein